MAEPNVSTKLCSKCKIEKPAVEFRRDPKMKSGLKSQCKKCCQDSTNAWIARNREHLRQYANARYAEKHPPKPPLPDGMKFCRRCNSTQPKSNFRINRSASSGLSDYCKPCMKIVCEISRKKNPETARRASRKHYLKNKEAYRALARARVPIWARKNPDKVTATRHRRRSRLKATGGSFSGEDLADIRKMQRDKCAACRCILKGRGSVDHIIPIARGGSNDRKNLQLMCRLCNSKKHAKDPIDFMKSLGRLL